MDPRLEGVLQTLRWHQGERHALGVRHASVFGSVARGETCADSDIDVLVDRRTLWRHCHVVNRRTLKPLLRETILHDAIDGFWSRFHLPRSGRLQPALKVRLKADTTYKRKAV
jgi:hypothetical protein